MVNVTRHPYLDWIRVALFLTGIILSTSDGVWFPIPNFAGIVLVGICGSLCRRVRREKEAFHAEKIAGIARDLTVHRLWKPYARPLDGKTRSIVTSQDGGYRPIKCLSNPSSPGGLV